MPRRLTIAGLMGIVVVVAAGMAALRHPSRIWDNGWFSVAVGSVFVAILAAMATSGPARVGCRGFAIAAGAYLLLASWPGLESSLGHRLATTAGLDFLYGRVHDKERRWQFVMNDFRYYSIVSPEKFWIDEKPLDSAVIRGPMTVPDTTGAERWTLSPHALLFFRIGHSMSALLAGMAGGFLCLYLSRRSDDRDRTPSTPAVSL